MLDRKTIRHNFSKAAGQYDEHAQLQQVVRAECIAMAGSCWREGSHILDLGCGTGAFSREIREQGLRWQVTQMDIAYGMCAAAAGENPAVAASADATPFASRSFDGVFSSMMLQWVADPLPVMREIQRVLKPSGTCIISTLVEGTLHELRKAFTAIDDAPHVHEFAHPARLTALMVHGGFRLLACEEETITIHYPDVAALMRSIKSIGASAALTRRKGGLMTPRQLQKLETAYWERYGIKEESREELPATWQVLYMVLEKTA